MPPVFPNWGRWGIIIDSCISDICHMAWLTCNSTKILWNAEPKNEVYMSPYVLAFTADTVEIRMTSNGSLIQTMVVPDLHLLSKKVKKTTSNLADFILFPSHSLLSRVISIVTNLPTLPTWFRAALLRPPPTQLNPCQSNCSSQIPKEYRWKRLHFISLSQWGLWSHLYLQPLAEDDWLE